MQKYIDYFIKTKKAFHFFHYMILTMPTTHLYTIAWTGKIHFLHNSSINASQVKIKGL